MKILKKKKKKIFFFFLRLGIFFSNWEKGHLNPIGKGAEFRPLRTPKKIPVDFHKILHDEHRDYITYFSYVWSLKSRHCKRVHRMP